MARGGPPKAHIMAAGLGTRLAPLTDRTAKPMAPILNRPVMEHILRLLARHGVTEVCVNLHHYADDIRGLLRRRPRASALQAHYSFEEKLLGTAGGTGGFRELLGDGTFLVVSGDALTDVDISSPSSPPTARAARIATIAVKEVDDPSRYGVVVHDDEPDASRASRRSRRAPRPCRDLCNCGIYAFEPAIFDLIPPGAFVDYAKDVFPRAARRRRAVPRAGALETYWNDVGSIREYRRGNFDALLGRVAVTLPGRELRLGVWVGEGTEVAGDVEIVPPVLLGDGCRVGARGPAGRAARHRRRLHHRPRRRARRRHPLERHRHRARARRWPAASSAARVRIGDARRRASRRRHRRRLRRRPPAPSSRPTPGSARRPRSSRRTAGAPSRRA